MTSVTCREIARALAMSGLESASTAGSDEVARHVSGCPPCSAFELQLALVAEAVRHACSDYEAEIPADFELRLLERLCS